MSLYLSTQTLEPPKTEIIGQSMEKIIKNSFKQADQSVADTIIRILKKYKSDIYMDNKIEEQTRNAIDSLDQITDSKYKDKLIELASYCMKRTS